MPPPPLSGARHIGPVVWHWSGRRTRCVRTEVGNAESVRCITAAPRALACAPFRDDEGGRRISLLELNLLEFRERQREEKEKYKIAREKDKEEETIYVEKIAAGNRDKCLFVCSFVHSFARPFVYSSVRSFARLFARSFVRSFVVRSSFSGDEGTVDMATPRPTSLAARIPAPASPPERHAVAATPHIPMPSRGRGPCQNLTPNSEESDLMPCTHVRAQPGTLRRMRETE